MSIISKKYKFVFLPIPKTATTSLNDVFSKEYESFWEPPENRHHCIVPDWAKDYFIFTVVRNPYQRTFSLWKEILKQYPSVKCYREFIQDWLIDKSYHNSTTEFLQGKSHPKFKHPQIQLTLTNSVQNLNPHILRFERLQENFNQLPFLKQPHELPHLNASHDPDRKKIIAENIDLVNQWCGEDFENFGYEMLRPTPPWFL